MVILPADPTDPDNPRIGWHNLVETGNVSATSEATGFPALNLGNGTTFQLWRASAAEVQSITVDFGQLRTIDYIGIARHNLGSAGYSYQLQGSTDGSIFDDLDAKQFPVDDSVILHEFEAAEIRYLSLIITPLDEEVDTPAEIAVLHAGALTISQRRIYVGHTPISDGRSSTVSTGFSENGQFLGRVLRRDVFATKVELANLTPDWYRANLRPFADVAATRALFFAWRPQAYPAEVTYCWATANPNVQNSRSNGMMSFDMSVQGILA